MVSTLDLTIAIPVKNEEANLAGCLSAIGKDLAARIVVIDSGSTDRTKEIASRFDVEIIDFKWDGKFPKKRNWFLRNHRPNTEWVMFLDADEYLTEPFKKELRQALENKDKVGYWLSYTIYFLGKKLKGGYPLNKLALFKVSAGEYEKIDENQWSHLDMEIHEHPVLAGKTGKLASKIDHRDFKGIQDYLRKHNEYSSWEASRFLKLRYDAKAWQSLTWKQKLKYRLMSTPAIGPIYFIGSYFLMAGFLDGSRGISFAIFKMSYFTEIQCKIKELRGREPGKMIDSARIRKNGLKKMR